jgi:hypothetical protein
MIFFAHFHIVYNSNNAQITKSYLIVFCFVFKRYYLIYYAELTN